MRSRASKRTVTSSTCRRCCRIFREQLPRFSRPSRLAGVAFQHADDYLDLFGDKRLGKKIGGDIKEGNITIFHESLIDLKDKFDFKKYGRIWHHPNLTAQDILWVQDLVKKTGIKTQVEEKMKKLIKEAKNCLEKANVNPKVKKTFGEFADFLIEREY